MTNDILVYVCSSRINYIRIYWREIKNDSCACLIGFEIWGTKCMYTIRIWCKIDKCRLETGESYHLFVYVKIYILKHTPWRLGPRD
jgi:hypothetical protein